MGRALFWVFTGLRAETGSKSPWSFLRSRGSQVPRLLPLSHWRVGFRHRTFGGHRHSVHDTSFLGAPLSSPQSAEPPLSDVGRRCVRLFLVSLPLTIVVTDVSQPPRVNCFSFILSLVIRHALYLLCFFKLVIGIGSILLFRNS